MPRNAIAESGVPLLKVTWMSLRSIIAACA
jgi:hypothetical protein